VPRDPLTFPPALFLKCLCQQRGKFTRAPAFDIVGIVNADKNIHVNPPLKKQVSSAGAAQLPCCSVSLR
jgi:hypothetical protein